MDRDEVEQWEDGAVLWSWGFNCSYGARRRRTAVSGEWRRVQASNLFVYATKNTNGCEFILCCCRWAGRCRELDRQKTVFADKFWVLSCGIRWKLDGQNGNRAGVGFRWFRWLVGLILPAKGGAQMVKIVSGADSDMDLCAGVGFGLGLFRLFLVWCQSNPWQHIYIQKSTEKKGSAGWRKSSEN